MAWEFCDGLHALQNFVKLIDFLRTEGMSCHTVILWFFQNMVHFVFRIDLKFHVEYLLMSTLTSLTLA